MPSLTKTLQIGRAARAYGWTAPIVAGIVVAVLPVLGLTTYWQREVSLVAIYAMIVVGFNLTFGYAGELALGSVAIFAGGAYAAGILVVHGHTEILLGLCAAVAISVVMGLITGIPSVRLGGWTLAVITLFMLVVVPDLVSTLGDITGGSSGLVGVLGMTFLGVALGPVQVYVLGVVLCVLCLVLVRNIVTSAIGVGIRAVRESPVLANSLGLRPRRVKLTAYVVGGIPAGLAGCLYAYVFAYLSPDAFSVNMMIAVLAASIVGGSSSIYGAPLGAAILVLGPLRSTALQSYSTLSYGAFLVVAGLVLQGGLIGLCRRLARRWTGHRTDHRTGQTSTAQEVALSAADHTPAATGDGLRAVSPATGAGSLLLDSVDVRFGGNPALRAVSFAAPAGAVTAIIGPNGAGKSTLLNVISGFVSPDQGSVSLDGTDLVRLSPPQCARAGIRRTFQTPFIQRDITALEVVRSGQVADGSAGLVGSVLRGPRHRAWQRRSEAKARAALETVGLAAEADTVATELSLGHRRLLEVARAMVWDGKVLLLDEPAAGLDPAGLRLLGDAIGSLRAQGWSVILVEHDVQFVMDVSDRVIALDFGEVIATGTPSEVQENAAVIRSYLGGHDDEAPPERADGPASGISVGDAS